MKVKCPTCKTVHEINESEITGDSLVVSCSSCDAKFRVRRNTPQPNTGDRQSSAGKTEDELAPDLFSDNQQTTDDDDDGVISDMDDSLDIESHRYGEDDDDELFSNDSGSSDNIDLAGFTNQSDPGSEKTEQMDMSDISLSSPDSGDPDDDDPLFDTPADGDPPNEVTEERPAPAASNNTDDQEDEFLKDLFSDEPDSHKPDEPTDDVQERLMRESAEQAEAQESPAEDSLFDSDHTNLSMSDGPESTQDNTAKDNETLYLKRASTGEILGPLAENELDEMARGGDIGPDDMISSDGKDWHLLSEQTSSADSVEPSLDSSFNAREFNENESTKSTMSGLSMSAKDDLFDDSSGFDDESTRLSVGDKKKKIDHTFIPGEETETPQQDHTSGGGGWLSVVFKLLLFLVIISSVAGGGYYAYMKYFVGGDDFFEKIRETVTETSGTLIDVRESLRTDRMKSYMKSLGILNRHMSEDETIPVIAGLDAQVKYNLMFSYGRKVEPVKSLSERISSVYADAPDNIDVAKGAAWDMYYKKQYGRVAEILAPFVEKNDPEIFYLLGISADAKGNPKDAEMFLKKGVVHSSEKNSKIPYALAGIKQENGDSDGAVAYLNRIISNNPGYLKAAIRKTRILLRGDKGAATAFEFLKSIDTDVISVAEDHFKAEYYRLLSDLHRHRGNFKNAISSIERALKIEGNNKEYLTRLAQLYEQTDNASGALEVFQRVQKIDKTFVPAIVGRAKIFLRLKKLESVFLEISKLDVEKMKDPEDILELGRIYHEIGEQDNALELFNRIINEHPSHVRAYLEKAMILLERGNIDKVKKIARDISDLKKDSYVFFLVSAVVRHKEGDFRKAEHFFNRAIKRNTGKDPLPHYYFGRLLFDMEKYNAASKQFSIAHNQMPDKYLYKQALALALEKSGKFRAVIKLLNEENIENYNRKEFYKSFEIMSDAYYNLGEYKNALEKIEKAMDIDSKSSYLYFKKARILYKLDRLGPAEGVISTAVMLDMKNFNNYMMYAKILIRRDDFKSAIEKINEAERLDPENQRLFLIKGMVYKEMDDYHKALEYFKKIDRNSPLLREAYAAVGKCYLELGNRHKAKRYMLKALNRGSTEVYFDLARIYYEEGNRRKARRFYKKTLSTGKNNRESYKKLAYINKEMKHYAKSLFYFRKYRDLVEDSSEKKMIDDELFFLKKRVSGRKYSKIMTNPDGFTDDGVSRKTLKKAKQLYMQGKILRKKDPDAAREKFRKVMKMLPKENKYYKKAFRAFKGQ